MRTAVAAEAGPVQDNSEQDPSSPVSGGGAGPDETQGPQQEMEQPTVVTTSSCGRDLLEITIRNKNSTTFQLPRTNVLARKFIYSRSTWDANTGEELETNNILMGKPKEEALKKLPMPNKRKTRNLLTKLYYNNGLQCPNSVIVNGKEIEVRSVQQIKDVQTDH